MLLHFEFQVSNFSHKMDGVGLMSNKTQLGMWRASLTLPTKASISPLRFQVGQVGQVILAVQVVKNLICGALLEVDIVTMALTSGGSI